MATTKQKYTTTALKSAINRYYLENFFIHGKTRAIVPDKRWDNGLCEIVKVLRQIDKVLGDVEDNLNLLGSDITKSASLKILGEIRSVLCKGELEGKNIEEVYEIAEETSRLLKGIGRKSFILNLTASLNSSESIKILNNCGKKLSDMMLLWKKTKLRSEKMTAEVKVLIKKILNESSIEKIIKHLNKFVDKKYTENWDLFRDTDKQITVEIKDKSSFKGSNLFIVKADKQILEQLNKMWTFEEIKETGNDAKTKILGIFKSLKEMVESDNEGLRYSKKFQILVKNIVCHLGGERSEESKQSDDENVEISVIDKVYIENEKGLVEGAKNAAKELKTCVESVEKLPAMVEEAQKNVETGMEVLKKVSGVVNSNKLESMVSVAKALTDLSKAEDAYNKAFYELPKENKTNLSKKLVELIDDFCESTQRVPTEVRVKELAKDFFIVKKLPKGKKEKNANDNIIKKYELKRNNRLLKALKEAKEANELYSKKDKTIEDLKAVKSESTSKLVPYIGEFAFNECYPASYLSTLLRNLISEEAKLRETNISCDEYSEYYLKNYINAEKRYNDYYNVNNMDAFLCRVEKFEEFLRKIGDIGSMTTIRDEELIGCVASVCGKLETYDNKGVKRIFNDTLAVAKKTKKSALEKAAKALNRTKKKLELLNSCREIYYIDGFRVAEKAIGEARVAEKAIGEARVAINDVKNKIEENNTAAVEEALNKTAKADQTIEQVTRRRDLANDLRRQRQQILKKRSKKISLEGNDVVEKLDGDSKSQNN